MAYPNQYTKMRTHVGIGDHTWDLYLLEVRTAANP